MRTSHATICCSDVARSRSASTLSSTLPAMHGRFSRRSRRTGCSGSRLFWMPRWPSSSTLMWIAPCAVRATPNTRKSRSRWSTMSSANDSPRWTLPPHPERDLLWFVANYAPEMESWERDIFLAVREESFYFYPVFATQIMNEGWASYWHARLLREADFVPQQAYLDAIKCHSDVVRPIAADQQVALS